MDKSQRKSVSGTDVQPQYRRRQEAPDFRGRVEKEVMRVWAQMNLRNPVYNHGDVPVDALVPIVTRTDGTLILDPTALIAVNTTIQWLFGTNGGRAAATQLMEIEQEMLEKERKADTKKVS